MGLLLPSVTRVGLTAEVRDSPSEPRACTRCHVLAWSAREEKGRSERLAGILPGKPDFVKVEWDRAAEKAGQGQPRKPGGGKPTSGVGPEGGEPPRLY